ncbi:MAG: DNA repair protein RadC [Candidatus Krumholzibacteria bacterium]|nr:DNA repair protein RadC [Candidatus Krumholzibacteria bacterium]
MDPTLPEAVPGKDPEEMETGELLGAFFLSSGSLRPEQCSRALLGAFGSLQELSRALPEEMGSLGGLEEWEARLLYLSFELGRRSRKLREGDLPQVREPDDVARHYGPLMELCRQEEFRALLLDSRHRVIRSVLVAKGSLNAAVVHPRELLRPAILAACESLLLMHNHPSGDPEPSEDDIRLTLRFREACELMGIGLLDHVILGQGTHCSLRERGYLP